MCTEHATIASTRALGRFSAANVCAAFHALTISHFTCDVILRKSDNVIQVKVKNESEVRASSRVKVVIPALPTFEMIVFRLTAIGGRN